MRRMKKMMAIAMLAVVASLGGQTAFATNGVILSDRPANSDVSEVKTPDVIDIIVVFLQTGVILSDHQ